MHYLSKGLLYREVELHSLTSAVYFFSALEPSLAAITKALSLSFDVGMSYYSSSGSGGSQDFHRFLPVAIPLFTQLKYFTFGITEVDMPSVGTTAFQMMTENIEYPSTLTHLTIYSADKFVRVSQLYLLYLYLYSNKILQRYGEHVSPLRRLPWNWPPPPSQHWALGMQHFPHVTDLTICLLSSCDVKNHFLKTLGGAFQKVDFYVDVDIVGRGPNLQVRGYGSIARLYSFVKLDGRHWSKSTIEMADTDLQAESKMGWRFSYIYLPPRT